MYITFHQPQELAAVNGFTNERPFTQGQIHKKNGMTVAQWLCRVVAGLALFGLSKISLFVRVARAPKIVDIVLFISQDVNRGATQ
jgi:hypothetical protein